MVLSDLHCNWKKYLLLCLMLIFCNYAVSQNKDIIPPSPQTTEFVKYINYDVTPYNGLPEISVVLYNISLKNLTIPISLSYHASGIKYGQADGEVGVGWTLNPGYRVARTVYGRPDELFTKPSQTSIIDSLSYYQNSQSQTDAYVSKFLYQFQTNIPRPYNHEMVDGEYDMFNFSLPTENGSFIIDDRTNRTVRSMEGSNMKFSYSTASVGIHNSISSFELIDETGVEYYMGTPAAGGASIYETSNSGYQGSLATAWALRELITPDREKVVFDYSIKNVSQWRQDLRSASITEGSYCYGDMPGSRSMGDVGVEVSYGTFFTDSITTDREIIKFVRNASTNAVNKLEIYTSENSLIKSILFFTATVFLIHFSIP